MYFKMKNQVLTALTVILTSCNLKINDDNSGFVNILFNVRGGYESINDTIIIGFNGFSELRYSKYKLHLQLPDSVYENLNNKFEDACIFDLDDKYPLYTSGDDYLTFTIMYSNGFKSKSLEVDWCGILPEKLEELLITLYKTRYLIRTNPDAITLRISWIYKIKEWQFSDRLRLQDNINMDLHLSEQHDSAIISYCQNMSDSSHRYLFLEEDSLYSVYLSRDYDSDLYQLYIQNIKINKRLPEEFNFNIHDIPETGLIIENNVKFFTEFFKTNYSGIYSFIYLYDELKDGSLAGRFYYVLGKTF